MPYKQKSPFGNFRNPNRTKNNYNPVDFKMPDLSPIYNKTADGSAIIEESDKEGANKGNINEKTLDNIDKGRGNPSTPSAIKNEAQKRKLEVKAEEKAFKQKLKDARQAKNLRAKYQTAEEKKQATEAFNQLKGEQSFRRNARLNNENKEDVRDRLKEEARQNKINKAAEADNFVQPSASLAKRPKSIIDNQFYNEPFKSSKSGAKIMKTKNALVKDADGGLTSDVFGRGRGYADDVEVDFIYGDERLDAIQDSTPKDKKIPIYNNTRNNPEPTYGEKLKKQNKIANSDERAEMESTLNSKMKTLPALKYMGAGSDNSDKRIQNMKKISMPKPNITVNSIDDIGGGFDIPKINQNNTSSLKDRERYMFKNQFVNKAFPMVSRKGSAFPMVSDSPLNFNGQNRNPNAGTGSRKQKQQRKRK